MKKFLIVFLVLFVWYFAIKNSDITVQIGTFETLHQCEQVRKSLAGGWNTIESPCWEVKVGERI